MPYLLEVESALRTSTLLNGVSGISKSTRQRVPKSLLLIVLAYLVHICTSLTRLTHTLAAWNPIYLYHYCTI